MSDSFMRARLTEENDRLLEEIGRLTKERDEAIARAEAAERAGDQVALSLAAAVVRAELAERERDEARAEVERLTSDKRRCHALLEGASACLDLDMQADLELHDEIDRELTGRCEPGRCTDSCERAMEEQRALVAELAEAALEFFSEPHDLEYPERDVYDQHDGDDQNAPLWSEAGLYGRVGKEAARTLLARKRRIDAVLAKVKEGK